MKKQKYFIGFILLILFVSASNSKINEPGIESIVQGNTSFAFELYKQLRTEKGNIFFSPFGISTVLAMTYTGSSNETESQMSKTLHFDENTELFHKAYKSYLDKLEGKYGEGIQLNIANKLWAQKDFIFLYGFMKLTKDNYNAGAENVDFVNEPEESRLKINKWVEGQTNEKIKDLLKQGTINDLTRLVLTNAIYFKGAWGKEFNKDLTKDEEFIKIDGNKIITPFMTQTTNAGYYESKLFTAVRIPYRENNHSMIMVLPRDVSGLENVEKELTQESYNKWKYDFRSGDITLTIPKFKTTFNFSLNNVLKEMGMPIAFDIDNADFSQMSKEKLFISNVIHKAFVEVNEEGTEAAAATAVVMMQTSVVMHNIFKADHPFIFMIVDNSTNSILFMGRIMDPTQ